jgi:hypothetical protein
MERRDDLFGGLEKPICLWPTDTRIPSSLEFTPTAGLRLKLFHHCPMS